MKNKNNPHRGIDPTLHEINYMVDELSLAIQSATELTEDQLEVVINLAHAISSRLESLTPVRS